MTYSHDERLALAALLEQTGPDAPTLCEGWQTGDLAAHLVLRERRPDAGAGMIGGPLAARTQRLQRRYQQRYPYPELIAQFRSGPPRLSPFALPGLDELANTVEYFVHHEDVRRAAEGWTARDLPAGLADALWKRLRGSRLLLRSAPTGIVLARQDTPGSGSPESSTAETPIVARHPTSATPGIVTVTGTPAELTLWSMGRAAAARVRLSGPDEAVARLSAWRQ